MGTQLSARGCSKGPCDRCQSPACQMQEQLDQVQSEYQTAHDQLRDTELQSLLFDAKVAGKLTEGTIQQLNSKMELAAHADNVFAQAIQFAHKLNQEKVEARRQIEVALILDTQWTQLMLSHSA